MRCFIGLLFCACIVVELSEAAAKGLQCLRCTDRDKTVDCYGPVTNSKPCMTGMGFKCGIKVGFTKSSGGDGWHRADISRGCQVPSDAKCERTGDQRCDCFRFCNGDNCNSDAISDSLKPADWGGSNAC